MLFLEVVRGTTNKQNKNKKWFCGPPRAWWSRFQCNGGWCLIFRLACLVLSGRFPVDNQPVVWKRHLQLTPRAVPIGYSGMSG